MITIVLRKEYFMKQQIKKGLLLLGMSLLLSKSTKVEAEDTQSFQKKTINYETKKEYASVIEKEVREIIERVSLLKVEKDITISAIGDCTLGTDTHFGYSGSFTDVFENNNRDFNYFFREVSEVLAKDDLTIANLETPLTDAGEEYRVEKKFNFKGDADYTNILIEGSIEIVNLANNHTYDYGEKGYNDTINNLENASFPYFGYENYTIMEIEGIKIGLAGVTGWNEEYAKKDTQEAINYFQEKGTDLIIMTYHWGIEREYTQNEIQENIARYAIDNGADLVLGHHPHVLQGIECYNGKYIVYSLGNFVFGGNKNPKDKDTMIFQETFHYENGILKSTSIEIIPCSLSGRTDLNNYQPIILEGEEQKRVLKKVLSNSTNLEKK